MLSPKGFAPLAALAAVLAALAARPAAAQQPADQTAIDQAVERGVKFLRAQQGPRGYFGKGTGAGPGKEWGVGYTCMAGLALVECGVPTNDPGLKRALVLVRNAVPEIEDTYEAALAILFLDRMKDKADKKYIHWLAGRLMAAQTPSGGWGYKLTKYTESEAKQLFEAVRKLTPKDADKDAFDPAKARAAALAALPPNMRRLPVLHDPPAQLPADPKEKRNDLRDPTTDNSNTHFAMVGLWNARKHDVPVDRTFTLINRRYRTTQGNNGSWAYDFARGANGNGAITCIGLLGVTIGHVVNPDPEVRPESDPVVLNAFTQLGKLVGAPVGDTANRPTVKDAGGLYFFWAMERIAVLYDIQTLNKKDWYLWGAEILLCHQLADGSWSDDGGFHGQSPVVNTALALMFLRRANLTPDLAKRLIVDQSVLTKKVEQKTAPKPEQPKPSPKEEVAVAPMPRSVEPKPVAAAPVARAPEPPPPAPEPVAEKTPWPLIVFGALGGITILGLLLFLILRRKKDGDEPDEDDERPKKKAKGAAGTKAKAKPKAKFEVVDDE